MQTREELKLLFPSIFRKPRQFLGEMPSKALQHLRSRIRSSKISWRSSSSGLKARNFSSDDSIRRQQAASLDVEAKEKSDVHQEQTVTPTTNKLRFIEPNSAPTVPMFRVLGPDGSLIGGSETKRLLEEADLSKGKILQLYKGMLELNSMDKVMFDSHRQGRISFYMTNFGEEATQFGSAGALSNDDWIFAQYRESGILLHRKMPIKLMLAQCFGNKEDLGKGRQMPIHYGNKQLNFVTISSTLATQLPQAAGAAYAFKRTNKNKDTDSRRVVACYFGEGAASEGDAHAAMNFAATLECPVMFICRNNGYAISTPTSEQFKGDGVVTRGLGYGIDAIRVDGNDLFAVYLATRESRRVCAERSKPVLVEAITYRLGHHSTSDDSSAYRPLEEVRRWESDGMNPIERLYRYLVSENLWSEEEDKKVRSEARAKVIEGLNYAEKLKKLPITSMFDDVYDELPANLRQQRDELKKHLEKYGQHYPIDEHESI